LERLHVAHQGIARTQQRARSAVYWPGISNDIRQMVERCEQCQERLPSLPKETLMSEPPPTRPFEQVAADLFYHAGRHYLVYGDRLSGFPLVAEWKDDPTSHQVAFACRQFFATMGVPTRFRSDNGPQFSGSDFQDFLRHWGVQWDASTPHYPQANYAECFVKKIKLMLSKLETKDTKSEEFTAAILELRNTPGPNGRSPNEIVFGRNARSMVPVHHSSFDDKWKLAADELDRKGAQLTERAKKYYDKTAHDLKPLDIGTKVRVQDAVTKRWDKVGIIMDVGERRNYRVVMKSGRVYWRNRRFLRVFHGGIENDEDHEMKIEPKGVGMEQRRSERMKKPTVRFGIDSIHLYNKFGSG